MDILDSSYFKRGDIVSVHWDGVWIPGRVIGCVESQAYITQKYLFEEFATNALFNGSTIDPPDESKKYAVRATLNRPREASILWRFRFFDIGMPMYEDFSVEDIRLEAHDPSWNPFAIEPYATPRAHRERGVYLPGQHYVAGDPVWVWEEDGWRSAVVVNVDRWISVRYLDNFRDRNGNRSKSYRTWQIWPVISEVSAIFKKKIERFL